MTKRTRKEWKIVRRADVAGDGARRPWKGSCPEFLFRATGVDTDPREPLDFVDNMAAELRRLDALAAMMGGTPDGMDRELCTGASEILQDSVDRMRRLLDLSRGICK